MSFLLLLTPLTELRTHPTCFYTEPLIAPARASTTELAR
jgi:hypothetical protein